MYTDDAFLDKHFAISITDCNGTIIDATTAFCDCSGYTKKEVMGKNHNIFRHEDMPDELFKDLWTTIKAGKSWTGDIKNNKKDGSFCWGKSYIEPIFDENKVIVGYRSAKFDITDKMMYKSEHEKNKLLNNQLLKHSKEGGMKDMVALIAHQWRQPLSSLLLTLSNLELRYEMGVLKKQEFSSALDKAKSTVAHLSKTIDVFSGYLKESEPEIVKAEEFFSKIQSIMLSIFESHDVEFVLEMQDNLYIDDRLDHVFLNLYQNALDVFITKEQEQKFIKTKLYKSGEKLIITVNDNAGGIAKDIQEKIFDPYFSTKSKNSSGLGLYMSKNILQEIQGEISVKNENGGACFRLEMPSKEINQNEKER